MNKLIEIQIFAPIIAWSALIDTKVVVFEQYESFQKMSYRNRFQVLGAGGVLNLSVPLVGGRDQKVMIRDLRIDHGGRWMDEHWRTLESAYNRSPFFFYYAPSLKQVMSKKQEFLWDFAQDSFDWVAKYLGWKGQKAFTSSYGVVPEVAINEDFRGRFLPKNREQFLLPSYQQVFGNRFESNLSILDLLFNQGPASKTYLANCPHF